jgi:hypothetical protein
MNRYQQTESVSSDLVSRFFALANPETRQLLTMGNQHDWDFQMLGAAPMPTEAFRVKEKWLIVPAHEDPTELPAFAMERMKQIFESGIRPKGFVLIHETSMLLHAPAGVDVEDGHNVNDWQLPAITHDKVKSVLATVGWILAGLAIVIGTAVLAVAAVALVASLLLPAAIITGAAAGIDPILVAVMDDDVWVEIARWDVEV